MRSFYLTLAIFAQSVALSAATTKIKCNWEQSNNHAQGYFKPAILSFAIYEEEVAIFEDSFLFRRYTPCWTGNFSNCAFGFDYDRSSNWTITQSTQNSLKIEAPGYYLSAELQLEASKDFKSLKKGEELSLNLSGDDGDGVMFYDESFSCEVL